MSSDRGGPRGPSRTVSLPVRTAQHSGTPVPTPPLSKRARGLRGPLWLGTRVAILASLSGEPSLGRRHDADSGSPGPLGGAASRAWHGSRAQTTGKMESADPPTFVTSRRAELAKSSLCDGGLRGLGTSWSGYRGPREPCPGHGGGSGEPEDA